MIDRASESHHSDDRDRRFVDLLVRYDEELRAGLLDASTVDAAHIAGAWTPPTDVLACLQLLEHVWPRAGRRPPDQGLPARVGRFHIDRTLGQGAFGIVYLATDPALHRRVALKVPHPHTMSHAGMLERFRREARAAAGLDHPNISPIHETSESGPVCYIAAAYCPGPNLAQWLRDNPGGANPRLAAGLVARLAEGVDYSHARGVLHRDIKPSNVMLVPRDNGAHADDGLPFVPRLGDFGLAKLAEDALVQATQSGNGATLGDTMLGTPSYMAPEQTGGRIERVGPAADVYSLGAVLYELLGGRPPFQGPNLADIVDQVRHADPLPVRRLRREVPRDLETICLKCLEKEPVRRFASARDLADDLQRFLDGVSIRAKPPGPIDIAWKWVRRRPAVALLIATVLFGMIGFAAQQSWHNGRLNRVNSDLEDSNRRLGEVNQDLTVAVGTAEKAQARAEQNERTAREVLYASDIRKAWRGYTEGDFSDFQMTIQRYRDGEPLAGYRGPEWHYLDRLVHCEERELTRLPGAVYIATFAPDGRTLAVVGSDALVRIIDFASGATVIEWSTDQQETNGATFSPDGATLWTAGDDGTIRAWDVATGRERTEFKAAHPAHAFDVLYDPNRDLLITCGKEPVIRLWDARTGESRGELPGHTATVEDIDWHPDGRRLVSASEDATARLFDVDTRESLRTFDADTWRLSEVALSPDGQLLAAASMDSVLTIWHLEQGKVSLRRQFLDPIDRLCFDPRGERLFIATRAGIVQALPLSRADDGRTLIGPTVLAWRAHPGRSYVLTFAPDGQSLITAGHDGRVVAWDTTERTAAKTREFRSPGVRHFAFDRMSGRLLAASSAGVQIWNVDRPAEEPTVVDPTHPWRWVAVSPRGDLFAAADHNGLLRTWHFDSPAPLATRQVSMTEGDGLSALSFSRDGRMLAAAESGGQSVLLLDPVTGATLDECDVGQARVAAFSPTEDVLALSPRDHALQLRRPPFDEPAWESERLPNRPGVVAFSPDGQRVLAGSDERIVRVWEPSTRRRLYDLRGHRATISAISVSPDNRTIATLGEAGLLTLWHMATGQPLLDMETGERDGLPRHCAFSPDGQWLAWTADHDVVRLLRLK